MHRRIALAVVGSTRMKARLGLFLGSVMLASIFASTVALATPDGGIADRRSATVDAGSGPRTASARMLEAGAIRDALDIPAASFISADLGSSDPRAAAVLSELLNVFPTKAGSYLCLSSGVAADASMPDGEGDHSTDLEGSSNELGNDLTQLRLELSPPANATGLEFNVVFLSEEFPEFVGSAYNDAFTAEMGRSELSVVGTQIYSPYNFAYDTQGNPVSVNTVYEYSLYTGTTYDGATSLLNVAAPLERDVSTGHVVVYLTVQDLSDSIYDSTVFVDNFRWRTDAVDPGAQPYLDTDGDALPDDWERAGVDYDGDGSIDLDLPAMGADPQHKDVFIEIDSMEKPPLINLGGWKIGGHQHKPKAEALALVIDAFRFAPVDNPDGTTGINAHIDAGPLALMNPATGEKWGGLSAGGAVPEVKDLGTKDASGDYDWSAFDAVKSSAFPLARSDVFHYCLFAHRYGGGTSSGISRNIPASDFVVADGAGSGDSLSVVAQAGTLMHEFGHNLGLWHGGDDAVNYKPNYLSVMNYSFQFPGLLKDGRFGLIDYSRGRLDDLDETALDETVGLRPQDLAVSFGTVFYDGGSQRKVSSASGSIDWDGNGTLAFGVAKDVNKDSSLATLTGHDDWASVRFDGGAVGMLGDSPVLEETTQDIEPPYRELDLPQDYGVSVKGGGVVVVTSLGGRSRHVQFAVTNTGKVAGRFKLFFTKFRGVDSSRIPSRIRLKAGETKRIEVGIRLPAATKAGERNATLAARSVSNPAIVDQAELAVRVEDRRRPQSVISASEARTNRTAILRFRINDPAPTSGKATVTISIRRNGREVKVVAAGDVATNRARSTTFLCELAKGRYTCVLTATDLAGNKARPVSAPLRVK